MSAPNLKEIEWAISELEGAETTKAGYILLAALYTCRDHMMQDTQREPQVSAYSKTVPVEKRLDEYGDSDFLQAVAGRNPAETWNIMNELMDTLQVVNRRAYDSVMRKITAL